MAGLNLSPKQALILELLIANGEMYGLDMVRKSEGKLKQGTVYVTLQRMAEKGFVESKAVEHDGPGLPRRMFWATGLGHAVFQAWEMSGLELAGGLA